MYIYICIVRTTFVVFKGISSHFKPFRTMFLDPVGSLVSTLWVVGWWVVVGHTFSKLVNFECC